MKDQKEPNSVKLNRIIFLLSEICYKLDIMIEDEYRRTHCVTKTNRDEIEKWNTGRYE